LLFTGARYSEILTLKWDYIDFEQGIARLPDSKTGAKTLYLPPAALAVLSAQLRLAGNPYVLPGNRAGAHFVDVAKPWQRIRRAAGLPQLRLHDLRHGFASVAVAGGDSLFIVGNCWAIGRPSRSRHGGSRRGAGRKTRSLSLFSSSTCSGGSCVMKLARLR